MGSIDFRFALFLVVAFGLGSGLAYFSMKPQKFADLVQSPILSSLSTQGSAEIESDIGASDESSSKVSKKAKKKLSTEMSAENEDGAKSKSRKDVGEKSIQKTGSEKAQNNRVSEKQNLVSDEEARALFRDLGIGADDLGGAGRGDLKSFKDFSEEKEGEHSGINSSLATRTFEESAINK